MASFSNLKEQYNVCYLARNLFDLLLPHLADLKRENTQFSTLTVVTSCYVLACEKYLINWEFKHFMDSYEVCCYKPILLKAMKNIQLLKPPMDVFTPIDYLDQFADVNQIRGDVFELIWSHISRYQDDVGLASFGPSGIAACALIETLSDLNEPDMELLASMEASGFNLVDLNPIVNQRIERLAAERTPFPVEDESDSNEDDLEIVEFDTIIQRRLKCLDKHRPFPAELQHILVAHFLEYVRDGPNRPLYFGFVSEPNSMRNSLQRGE